MPSDETTSDIPEDKERLVRREMIAKARRVVGQVPFLEEALAAYYCAMDPETPHHVKAVIIGALAYFIMPTDVVPDFILGFGYTDDAAVFWGAWRTVRGHVTDSHVAKARETLRRISGEESAD